MKKLIIKLVILLKIWIMILLKNLENLKFMKIKLLKVIIVFMMELIYIMKKLK